MRTDAAVQQAVEEQVARPAAPNETRVGVVFVHGIGEQPESDTIREFGGALLGWLQRWHAARGCPRRIQCGQRGDGELADLRHGDL